MYKVVKKFRDVVDSDHIYEIDSIYPRDGYEPSEERIEELLADDGDHRSKPLKGSPLIEVVETITAKDIVQRKISIDSDEQKPLEAMTVKELKKYISSKKEDFDTSLKKPELLKLAQSIAIGGE